MFQGRDGTLGDEAPLRTRTQNVKMDEMADMLPKTLEDLLVGPVEAAVLAGRVASWGIRVAPQNLHPREVQAFEDCRRVAQQPSAFQDGSGRLLRHKPGLHYERMTEWRPD